MVEHILKLLYIYLNETKKIIKRNNSKGDQKSLKERKNILIIIIINSEPYTYPIPYLQPLLS